ncbi:MAG TPA: HPr-rel-A system PqqD family peptide chaperone [Gaiellaceae bacterium]|nr:HPr-rel-A system PqqD family peptide chaperone [Gaiellaceae bacterium]
MAASKPRIRGDLTLVELDQEAVVYDPLSGLVHYLNPMAALVLQLCDGTATVKETTAELAEANEVEPEAITSDVRKLMKTFRDAGLVVPSAGATRLIAAKSDASDERRLVRREVPKND